MCWLYVWFKCPVVVDVVCFQESVMPMTSQLSDFQAALDELQAHNRTRFSLDKTSVSRSKMREKD